MTTNMSKKIRNVAWPLAFGILFIVLWQLEVFNRMGGLSVMQLPLPSSILKVLTEKYAKLFADCLVTMRVSLLGLVIGSSLGYLIAVIATMFPKWGYGGLTVVSALNAIPIVALASIMNRWFTVAMWSKVSVVTIVCMACMAINSYQGLNDLKPFSLDLMKSYAANKKIVFTKLRIPNSIPNVFVALKINIVSAVMAALISEYFSKDTAGLGFTIKTALKMGNQKATGWAYIVTAAVISILLYLIVIMVERRAISWHASHR